MVGWRMVLPRWSLGGICPRRNGILALLRNGTGVFAYDERILEISAQKRVSYFHVVDGSRCNKGGQVRSVGLLELSRIHVEVHLAIFRSSHLY